ncbi:major facilitator superfamily transporter [Microdochium trichocladiopsis]|uniref:Major facilitator superfamily transporter n=1 Tax=Microdochium trichocladiopsis TaxID=1682393 RepID=A0A9P8XRN1_9PEZI|nr:major facilitator superfamily transporter [Microdochium trichocladiopsis]KAH7014153.1 major facilitator superfamily transporter [Microdochium trichocladiopsis]
MGFVGHQLKKTKVGAVIVSVFDWYPAHYPAEERKLLHKLDLAILVFGCLSFFCRFLGQNNITNAYVSGMSEDLNAHGNELNYYLVAYNTAYVIGQIPLMTLQTKARIAPFLLPTLQIFWAIIAFCQSRVTQNWHLYILRATTGFLEASSFGGTHLILGSWFKDEELFKRAGVWFTCNALGGVISGYLQAATYSNLQGVLGHTGWQWLFLIQGVITLPTAFIGFAFWPGLPISPKRWYFTDEEHALAVKRIPVVEKEGITWKTFKYTLSRPMWWICVPCYICLCQAAYWTGYMQLWLKRSGFSVQLVNILPTFIDIIRALSSWLGTTLAGCLSLRGIWSFQFTFMFFACIVLAVWNVPDVLKFVAFYCGGFSGMASPILYSWLNTTLKENYGERGLIISSMMTLGFCMQIWVPLFTYPTVQAPRFPNGYPASAVFEFAMWAFLMFGSWYMARWKLRQQGRSDVENPATTGETRESGDVTNLSVDQDEKRAAVSGVAVSGVEGSTSGGSSIDGRKSVDEIYASGREGAKTH